jgi:hypothetical protein
MAMQPISVRPLRWPLLFGANQLQVSGNLGYTPQSGMPSADCTTYSRTTARSPVSGHDALDVFTPLRGLAGGRTGATHYGTGISPTNDVVGTLRLQYGFAGFGDVPRWLHYFSPYVCLTYALPQQRIDFAFTSATAGPIWLEKALADAGCSRTLTPAVPRVSFERPGASAARREL